MKDLMKLVVFLIVLLIAASFMLPSSYQVKKSVNINAPASIVFDEISDLRKWQEWSPWLDSSQNIQLNFSDDTRDIGGFAEWNSTSSNQGRHIISDIEKDRSFKVEFEFSVPYSRKAKSQFLV